MAKPVKAPPPPPIDWPRSDPAELAKFDPDSKTCSMNCGRHSKDPRSYAELKFQCGDCYE
jgi:hypothetical protein